MQTNIMKLKDVEHGHFTCCNSAIATTYSRKQTERERIRMHRGMGLRREIRIC